MIDVEVFGVIRREHLLGRLDGTAAAQAVADLRDWPGERYGHRSLLERAWQLRATVRGWDAAYVALAEALDATLLTMDARLAAVPGPACRIDIAVQRTPDGRAPLLCQATVDAADPADAGALAHPASAVRAVDDLQAAP